MDLTNWVQFLHKGVCISFCTRTLGKGMNSSLLPTSYEWIVGQTWLFSLGMTTSLGEGKLWIQTVIIIIKACKQSRFPWVSHSLSIPICHHFWQVPYTASSVCTELTNISFCLLANIGVSICRSPKADVVYEFILTFFTSAQHVLLILLGWFVRWEVSGHTATVL